MGRFIERYKKHPERGTERYIDQARSYIASLTIGRGFNESMDDYLIRSPETTKNIQECKDDIIKLSDNNA